MKASRRSRPAPRFLAWAIPAMAVAVLGGFLAGQRAGGKGPAATAAAAPAAGEATDISSLSPPERASRLYDRVMRYGERGQPDSARFFASMAVEAYAMLGPPDAHARYDVGMIYLVSGDTAKARTEVDAILAERPTHLLGLLLGMRSAATPETRASFARRLLAASQKELASPQPEYGEHQHDLEGGLQAARAAKP